MKKNLLLFWCVLAFYDVSAQSVIKFDNSGRIIAIPDKAKKHEPDTKLTDKYSKEKTTSDFKSLTNKFKATQKSLKDKDSDLNKFYLFLGVTQPTLDAISKDLTELIKSAETKKCDKLTFYTNLESIRTNAVLTSTANIYAVKNKADTIEIRQKSNLNVWTKSLVKTSYEKNKEILDKIDATKFLSNVVYLQYYRSRLDSFLNEVQKPDKIYNTDLSNSANRVITTINNDEKIKEFKQLAASDWCLNLAWMNDGQIRLNPLDSKKDEFIISYSKEAQERAEYFNKYIEHLLEWYITKDTTANIDKFKLILNQRNIGTDLYKPFNFNDLIASVSGKTMEDLKPDSLTLNQILSESTKCQNHKKQFFANQNDPKLDSYFARPVIIEDSKVFFVQNVSKKETFSFDTNSVIIKDRSAFQEEIDTLLGSAATLGAFAVSIAGYTQFLPTHNIVPDNVYIKTLFSPESHPDTISLEKDKTFNNFNEANQDFKYELIENGSYNEDLFKKAKKSLDADTNTIRFKKSVLNTNKKMVLVNDYEDYLIELQHAYNKNMLNEYNVLVDNMKRLRTNISMLCEIFSKSSLPDKLLDERAEKITPEFATQKFEIKTLDKPTHVTVKVKRNDGKEIKESTRFKFKTGKTYRIQLSAGLALTGRLNKDKELIQTTITEKDGGIDIKNTYQPVRFVAGLHCHLGKGLHLQNNGFIFGSGARNFAGRTSFYIGVGIPKPLENIYLGVGLDLWPGLKLTFGCHAYRNDSYQISNNKIVEQKTNFNGAPFIGINIDPTGLIRGLEIIKKLN